MNASDLNLCILYSIPVMAFDSSVCFSTAPVCLKHYHFDIILMDNYLILLLSINVKCFNIVNGKCFQINDHFTLVKISF